MICRFARALALALCTYLLLYQLAEIPALNRAPSEAELQEARIFNADDAQWFGEDPEASSLVELLAIGEDSRGQFARLTIDGNERLARVGEKLVEPCLVIHQLAAASILLDHCGSFVLLTLGLSSDALYEARLAVETSAFAQHARPEIIDRRRDADINLLSRDYHRRLYDKPLSLLGQMNIEVRQDSLGFRQYFVFPGKDARLFDQTPLQPGDQILAINGIALSDREAVSELYERLRDVSHLTITLSRDESRKVLILGF